MSRTIEFHSRIGDDGVLDLHIPLQQMGAGLDVVVTVRPVQTGQTLTVTDPVQWRKLLDECYGSCADLGLERQPQGEFESREAME